MSKPETTIIPEYVKRNVKGSWQTLEVSPEQISKIKKTTNEENVRVLRKLADLYFSEFKQKYGELFAANAILALWDKLSKSYSFRRDDFVDNDLRKENLK